MATVKAVPEGFTTVTPLLNVKGAAEAIDFYKKAFGAEELSRVTGPGGGVMHAQIKIGNGILMISDAVRNAPTQSSCHIYVENADALFKRATDAGATVIMPLQDMFWGDRYGLVADKWGNRWSVAAHKEDVSQEELEKRAAEAMKNMK